MNRRTFLTGLLASAAVAPLVAKIVSVTSPPRTIRTFMDVQGIRDVNVLLKPADYAGMLYPMRTISLAEALEEFPVP